jgi:L-alanine-DL-glutamate epimerase-like enolase superfamily enzyme
MSDGKVSIPQKPGLGVEINRDALAEFIAAAKKLRD